MPRTPSRRASVVHQLNQVRSRSDEDALVAPASTEAATWQQGRMNNGDSGVEESATRDACTSPMPGRQHDTITYGNRAMCMGLRCVPRSLRIVALLSTYHRAFYTDLLIAEKVAVVDRSRPSSLAMSSS